MAFADEQDNKENKKRQTLKDVLKTGGDFKSQLTLI